MDDDRFDAQTRVFDARSRRRWLGALTGAVAFGPLTLLPAVEAKKKRKKKKNSCPSPPPPPPLPPPPLPPSCAATCPSNCERCFIRPEAPTLCGGVGVSCGNPCTSDNDCIATTFPYCVSQFVDRATGQVFDICGSPGGFCISIAACS